MLKLFLKYQNSLFLMFNRGQQKNLVEEPNSFSLDN